MLKEECSAEKFKLEHNAPDDFVLCVWQKTPNVLPIWIAYRTIVVIYLIITFYIMVFRPASEVVWYKTFIYVGYWEYFIETFSFGLALYIAVEKFVKEKKNPELPPLEKMPWHYKMLWLLYTMAAPTALAISTMFWFFTYDSSYHTLVYSIVTRALNSVVFIIDAFLNAIPVRILHFYIPAVFIIVYVLFTITYQLNGGTGNRGLIPIYSILDWREPKKAISTVSIYVSCVLLFHCGLCVLNIMKNWLKKPPNE